MITGLGIIAAIILILLRLLVDLIGVYITSSDKNLLKAARFMKKDHVRSDIEAIEELKKYDREDIMVIVGGVIPKQDYQFLFDAGAVAVFGPGTKISDAAIKILEILID